MLSTYLFTAFKIISALTKALNALLDDLNKEYKMFVAKTAEYDDEVKTVLI